MADFVAVIRRAVDGLATNTPEARVRVYEKARGAVQRQLENMKPRPPEDMLRRQMDKLEAAILEVESEHAEALPAEPEAVAAPVVMPADVYEARAPEPAAVEQVEPAEYPAETVEQDVPVTASEPVVAEPVEVEQVEAYQAEAEPETSAPAVETDEAAAWHSPTVDEEPAVADAEEQRIETERYEPSVEPVAAELEVIEPAETHGNDALEVEPQHAVAYEPAPVVESDEQRYGDWRDDVPEEHATVAASHDHPVEPDYAQPVEHADTLYPAAEDQSAADAEAAAAEWMRAQAAEAPSVDATHDAVPVAQAEWPGVAGEPADTASRPQAANTAASVWDEVDDLTRHLDTPAGQGSADAYFSPEMRATATPVRMPAASDIPQPPEHQPPEHRADDHNQAADPFEAYVNAQPSAPDVASQQATGEQQAQPVQDTARDPWSDLEDLIGYTKEATPADDKPKADGDVRSEDDFSDLLAAAPAKPYRVTAKRKRSYTGLIVGIVALLIVGGGGYAAWMNRDTLNEMVGGLMSSGGETTEQSSTTAPEATETPATTPEAEAPAAEEGAAAPSQGTATPPAADGSTAGSKFTQRLLEDGSEVDEGPGGAGALAQNAEGQSVSQLNAPPADPRPASAPANAAGAAGTAPAAPGASPSDAPAAAGERMFLYEERIGQTAPTAIEGSVSWSLQREPAQNGGPAEPVVQGRITVPGRGLTALLTVKRNTDSSLPASHLIEIVFAVPPDFEGGAIDSVLRIAMKQTEQDRGNALVAVPAKITDDFHMIALNDFPDARATNMDLLRSRNWMDIPVAYRNGRRALLTLQKGPEGAAAFDEAIREWGQQGGSQTGQ